MVKWTSNPLLEAGKKDFPRPVISLEHGSRAEKGLT
jgi:hypothetical protein